MTPYEQAVLEILRESLSIEVSGLDVNLIESGMLDSLGIVVLVSDLEERFEVRIPFETVEIDDLGTVRSVARLVETRAQDPAA